VTAYDDRRDAGRRLVALVGPLVDRTAGEQPLVLGLPRGGVPVAFEVARALDAPLDVLLVRKLGVPFQPELAMGALGEGGVTVYNDEVLRRAGVSGAEVERIRAAELTELARRADRYRTGRPPPTWTGRTVLIVDDGIATGATARAACRVAQAGGARRVVFAAPVGARDSVEALEQVADEVVCPLVVAPGRFGGVGQFYRSFAPTPDEEVLRLLAENAAHRAGARTATIRITAGAAVLSGERTMPPAATGLVVFAHGSGSSRFSPRNRFVAKRLNDAGFGTLLLDLLTAGEEHDRRLVFDIELLAARLGAALAQGRGDARWVACFGASTGAAAALWAAAEPDADVAAVVSRGGRPDLSTDRLSRVRAPTLLVVGGDDREVLALNRSAQRALRCANELAVVPGATHLFEEPGALERVADLAVDWFRRHGSDGAAF
jgi:putative phosphoribosyl transferase